MQNIIYYILVLVFIWLLIVSYFIYRFFVTYKKLTDGIGIGDLKKILEKILERGDENTKNIKEIVKKIEEIEEKDRHHIQKMGLIRFNPFTELGGDHSFCLAILDHTDTGVVITGLHTRDRTRVYMKDIKNGKSSLELSNEEMKALSVAQKNK